MKIFKVNNGKFVMISLNVTSMGPKFAHFSAQRSLTTNFFALVIQYVALHARLNVLVVHRKI